MGAIRRERRKAVCVRKARWTGPVSGCGHQVWIGERILRVGGRWLCEPCGMAAVESEGQEMTRFSKAEQVEMLTALACGDTAELASLVKASRSVPRDHKIRLLAAIMGPEDERGDLAAMITAESVATRSGPRPQEAPGGAEGNGQAVTPADPPQAARRGPGRPKSGAAAK
jgi:hypothetical protein